ncbi:putative F-box protein [Helianthus debilis subsp. tardiflorus]
MSVSQGDHLRSLTGISFCWLNNQCICPSLLIQRGLQILEVIHYVSGNQATLNVLYLPFPILDIYSFKEKIYTISSSCHLYEVTLNATCLMLLGMKNFQERGLLCLEFVNSGKTLYVVSCIARDV